MQQEYAGRTHPPKLYNQSSHVQIETGTPEAEQRTATQHICQNSILRNYHIEAKITPCCSTHATGVIRPTKSDVPKIDNGKDQPCELCIESKYLISRLHHQTRYFRYMSSAHPVQVELQNGASLFPQ